MSRGSLRSVSCFLPGRPGGRDLAGSPWSGCQSPSTAGPADGQRGSAVPTFSLGPLARAVGVFALEVMGQLRAVVRGGRKLGFDGGTALDGPPWTWEHSCARRSPAVTPRGGHPPHAGCRAFKPAPAHSRPIDIAPSVRAGTDALGRWPGRQVTLSRQWTCISEGSGARSGGRGCPWEACGRAAARSARGDPAVRGPEGHGPCPGRLEGNRARTPGMQAMLEPSRRVERGLAYGAGTPEVPWPGLG